jgi:eukaryotic-like serine/threonine-protein kinase
VTFARDAPGRSAALGSETGHALPVEPPAAPRPDAASATPPARPAPADMQQSAAPPTAAPPDAARPERVPDAATSPVAIASPTRPSPPRAAKPSGPPGFITIDMVNPAEDYATIYIDGKSHGYTPLSHVELAPGRHAVRAVGASGETRDFAIAIESGKVAPTLRVEWK